MDNLNNACSADVHLINQYCSENYNGILRCDILPSTGRVLYATRDFPAGTELFKEPPLHAIRLNPQNRLCSRLIELCCNRDFELQPIWYWCALNSVTIKGGSVVDGLWNTPVEQQKLLEILYVPEDISVSEEVTEILNHLNLIDVLDSLEVERMLQMWIHNCFEQYTDPEGYAIYFMPSFCSHSCIPNAIWSTDTQDVYHLRSRTDIKTGEEVTLSYLSEEALVLPTSFRRAVLESVKNFRCTCERCESEADLSRGFRCPLCNVGTIYASAEETSDYSRGLEFIQNFCTGENRDNASEHSLAINPHTVIRTNANGCDCDSDSRCAGSCTDKSVGPLDEMEDVLHHPCADIIERCTARTLKDVLERETSLGEFCMRIPFFYTIWIVFACQKNGITISEALKELFTNGQQAVNFHHRNATSIDSIYETRKNETAQPLLRKNKCDNSESLYTGTTTHLSREPIFSVLRIPIPGTCTTCNRPWSRNYKEGVLSVEKYLISRDPYETRDVSTFLPAGEPDSIVTNIGNDCTRSARAFFCPFSCESGDAANFDVSPTTYPQLDVDSRVNSDEVDKSVIYGRCRLPTENSKYSSPAARRHSSLCNWEPKFILSTLMVEWGQLNEKQKDVVDACMKTFCSYHWIFASWLRFLSETNPGASAIEPLDELAWQYRNLYPCPSVALASVLERIVDTIVNYGESLVASNQDVPADTGPELPSWSELTYRLVGAYRESEYLLTVLFGYEHESASETRVMYGDVVDQYRKKYLRSKIVSTASDTAHLSEQVPSTLTVRDRNSVERRKAATTETTFLFPPDRIDRYIGAASQLLYFFGPKGIVVSGRDLLQRWRRRSK